MVGSRSVEMSRRETLDGFVLEHERGRLEVHELAPGVIFQDYYGVVIDEYFEPVKTLAEERLSRGARLSFFSNISRVRSSPTDYRRNWGTWFKVHDGSIDGIMVLAGSALPVLAVRAVNLITGGSIKVSYDPEVFQSEVERVVGAVWENVDASDTGAASAEASRPPTSAPTPDPQGSLIDAGSVPDAFASPLERKLALDALNAVLFTDSSDTAPASGHSIGRFVVRHRLGSGGMGVVYACRDEVLGRDVAVKLLHAQGDEGSHRRILREAKAMARLTHANVVTVYEIGEAEGAAFLVMELVQGMTVRRWLTAEESTHARILEVFLAAGRGLAAAHANGLVHRDFKPENVMIGDDGRVLVMDFGLARSSPVRDTASGDDGAHETPLGLTKSGLVAGTPAYMAPETLSGGGTNPRTDQFSFCAALWEGLHGQRPFVGADMGALTRAVMERPPIVPRGSTVAKHTQEALERGMMPDPAKRWRSMEELMGALSRPRPWFVRLFSRA